MSIHAVAYLAKSLQTPCLESHFKVGDFQLASIRGLAEKIDVEIQLPNRDALPTPPAPLIMQSSKLPRVKD